MLLGVTLVLIVMLSFMLSGHRAHQPLKPLARKRTQGRLFADGEVQVLNLHQGAASDLALTGTSRQLSGRTN